jgi:hypothetical protein
MNKKLLLFFTIIFLNITGAQWEVAGSFNIKSQIPRPGIGVQFGKNLPIQSPDLGFKVRLEVDFFNSTLSDFQTGKEEKLNYLNSDYQLSLIASYFSGLIQPYTGIGAGAGHFILEEFTKTFFFTSWLAGLEINLFKDIIPFAEIQIFKYYGSFPVSDFKRKINSLVYRGIFGLRFKLNMIDKDK